MKKLIYLVLGLLVLTSACHMPTTPSVDGLPVVGSAANLKALISAQQKNYDREVRDNLDLIPEVATASGAGDKSYSTTNVQVQGIDEADVVKTDGTYLYHISGSKVLMTQAWPASSLKIAMELEFEQSFHPSTLYVDDNYLVVIGMQQEEQHGVSPEYSGEMMFMPILPQSTKVLIYDISDKANIVLSRDIGVDGYNATSRKKDNFLYLVNSRYVGWFLDGQEPQRPWYKDSTSGEEKIEIAYEDIRYFPNAPLDDYVIFAALDLDGGKLKVDSYLGWSQNMYMSHDNLYLAMTDSSKTTVHRFAVDGLNLDYKGEGTVAGIPLNQFSMDEHDGYFRIATTDYTDWERTSNNLYVLDGSMEVVGQINDIAPGEHIYSARFMGDKGYLVTFEMVDPLFVIDLSNPRKPSILGELKIPGFSNYLHPLDENHLLGIGQDTELKSREGREFVTIKGMKLAIFDVSDVNNPKEKHVEIIGGQGTWSEALYNHKAVFFHGGVLAFPVSITAITPGDDWRYDLAFSGALFYDINLETGFTQLGKISHNTGQENHYRPDVRRIVRIEDVYYTISDALVMAHGAGNFKKLAEIELPGYGQDYWILDGLR